MQKSVLWEQWATVGFSNHVAGAVGAEVAKSLIVSSPLTVAFSIWGLRFPASFTSDFEDALGTTSHHFTTPLCRTTRGCREANTRRFPTCAFPPWQAWLYCQRLGGSD